MIKKYKSMIFWGFLLLVFIQKCTTINITSAALFKKKEYDNYPYLKDGVYSEKLEILKIAESPYNKITYDEKGNYCLIYGDEKIIKIDGLGKTQFTIEITAGISYANMGSYVFTESEVYDLTQTKVIAQKLKEVMLIPEKEVDSAPFLSLLEKYYDNASIVIYPNVVRFSAKNYKVYLKIGGNWIAIYLPKKNKAGIELDASGEIRRKYPEKFERLIFLKNTENDTYATRSSGGEQFLSTPDFVDTSKEDKLTYPKYEGIKRHFYQKEKTHGTIVYTSIPVSFMGTLYLSLKINGEVFKFKEESVKDVGFIERPKYYVSHYVLPKIAVAKNNVSFLKVFYPSNAFDSETKGVYIIKPKNSI